MTAVVTEALAQETKQSLIALAGNTQDVQISGGLRYSPIANHRCPAQDKGENQKCQDIQDQTTNYSEIKELKICLTESKQLQRDKQLRDNTVLSEKNFLNMLFT